MDINHLFAKQDYLELVGEQGFRGGFLLIEDGSGPCGHMGLCVSVQSGVTMWPSGPPPLGKVALIHSRGS